mmetsp:Transcript_85851/g.255983  ORF Transcript_85851/g.255983 Transcript_85851/m.255983 type:complete len:220 (-) Transcript_85851:622-1281(-)
MLSIGMAVCDPSAHLPLSANMVSKTGLRAQSTTRWACTKTWRPSSAKRTSARSSRARSAPRSAARSSGGTGAEPPAAKSSTKVSPKNSVYLPPPNTMTREPGSRVELCQPRPCGAVPEICAALQTIASVSKTYTSWKKVLWSSRSPPKSTSWLPDAVALCPLRPPGGLAPFVCGLCQEGCPRATSRTQRSPSCCPLKPPYTSIRCWPTAPMVVAEWLPR